MSGPRSMRLLRLAAILALVGLAFMVWSLLDPRPVPIMAAMSVGQGIGTLSFLLFVVVVITDAWRASRRAEEKSVESDEEEKK